MSNGNVTIDFSNVEIKNCINNGNITSQYRTGGIVGGVFGEKIIGCKNNGTITSNGNIEDTDERVAYVGTGGIAGRIESGSIEKCSNTGNVTASIGYFVGGIVGFAQNSVTVSESYNTGNISAYMNGTGGIIGRCDGATVTNCYNYLRSNGSYIKTVEGLNAGGIIGVISGEDKSRQTSILNCYSIGENIICSNASYKANLVGGIWNNTKIDKTYYLNNSALSAIGVIDETISCKDNSLTKTDTDFKRRVTNSSSVAYLLNGSKTSGVWSRSSSINNGYPYLVNCIP